MGHENSTQKWLDKAFDYLVKISVASDRPTVPNIAVVVTNGESSPTANTIAAVTKAGWNIIFLVVTSKVESNQNKNTSSKPQQDNKNYYAVDSFSELKSLEFQERFARAVCGHGDYIKKTKIKLKRNSGDIEHGYVNVATKKPASQSSTEASADLAVDGIESPHLRDKSCSITETRSEKHWWELDLEENYDIQYVSVMHTWNRNINFDIYGHSDTVKRSGQLCQSVDNTKPLLTQLLECITILEQKRYIRIQQFAASDVLILCEVAAFTAWPPGYYNVALKKPTSQNTTDKAASDVAVDGNTHNNWLDGSCAFSKPGVKEWWQVDLKQPHDIFGVTVFNRQDHWWHLENFGIFAFKDLANSDRLENELCGEVTTDHFVSMRHFECKLLQKRYVIIQHSQQASKKLPLTLCEVQVWAECEEGKYGRYCKDDCENCDGNNLVFTPERQTSSKGGVVAGVVVFILIVLAGVAVGGAFYYKKYYKKDQQSEDPDEPDDPDAPPISFKWFWEKEDKRNKEPNLFIETS